MNHLILGIPIKPKKVNSAYKVVKYFINFLNPYRLLNCSVTNNFLNKNIQKNKIFWNKLQIKNP